MDVSTYDDDDGDDDDDDDDDDGYGTVIHENNDFIDKVQSTENCLSLSSPSANSCNPLDGALTIRLG